MRQICLITNRKNKEIRDGPVVPSHFGCRSRYTGPESGMFIIEAARFIKQASLEGSRIDPESRRECEGIMSRIYGESPQNWPYGLDISGHDGGVWLVRDPENRKAAGFVGWQQRNEKAQGKMLKVGYYSIGILPEYRGNGFATSAVSTIIREKSASVDVVRAFIVPGNDKSVALAHSLGVPIVHDV